MWLMICFDVLCDSLQTASQFYAALKSGLDSSDNAKAMSSHCAANINSKGRESLKHVEAAEKGGTIVTTATAVAAAATTTTVTAGTAADVRDVSTARASFTAPMHTDATFASCDGVLTPYAARVAARADEESSDEVDEPLVANASSSGSGNGSGEGEGASNKRTHTAAVEAEVEAAAAAAAGEEPAAKKQRVD